MRVGKCADGKLGEHSGKAGSPALWFVLEWRSRGCACSGSDPGGTALAHDVEEEKVIAELFIGLETGQAGDDGASGLVSGERIGHGGDPAGLDFEFKLAVGEFFEHGPVLFRLGEGMHEFEGSANVLEHGKALEGGGEQSEGVNPDHSHEAASQGGGGIAGCGRGGRGSGPGIMDSQAVMI